MAIVRPATHRPVGFTSAQMKTLCKPIVTDDALNFQEPPQSPYAYPVPARPAPQPSPYSAQPSPYSAPVPPPPPHPSQYLSSASAAQSRMDEMQSQPSNNQPQLLRSDVSSVIKNGIQSLLPQTQRWAMLGQNLWERGEFGDGDSQPDKNKSVKCKKIATPPYFTCNFPSSSPSFDEPTDNPNKNTAEQEEDEEIVASPFALALAAFMNE